MTLDGLTLHIDIKELQHQLTGAKVQKIGMPSKEEINLNLYTPDYGNLLLKISADAGDCSIYISNSAKKNPKVAKSFCMLLRKYLSGARIIEINQISLDRVVKIKFLAKDELLRDITLFMIIEIMGKYSNIILTNSENKIIDSIKRVPADISSMRQILPGMTYQVPPQKKYDPSSLSLTTLQELLLTRMDTRITSHMTGLFDGMSLQTAKEILYRSNLDKMYTSELNESSAKRLANAIKDFYEYAKTTPKPCVQLNGEKLPVFFSCVPYLTFPEQTRVYFDNTNEMLDYYYSVRQNYFKLIQQKESLSKILEKNLNKVEKRIKIYESDIEDANRADKIQKRADAIIANLYRLKKGMSEFEDVDYETGEKIKVKLDLSMTPQALAQKLYKRIAKYKKAAALNAKKLLDAIEERDFINGTLLFIDNSQNSADISEIKSTLTDAGYIQTAAKHKKAENTDTEPMSFAAPGGYTVLVGKNDRQNEKLTLHTAAKDDIWFHAQKIPGSHVILITNGKDLDEIENEAVEYAASLAVQYSRAKQSGKTPVDYTQRKNIKKPPASRPGKVIYDNYFTLYTEPHLN